MTEELCEFRRRLSDSTARQDRWWKHDSTADSMAQAVRNAADTFTDTGRHWLEQAVRSGSDLNTVSAESFAAGRYNFFGFGSTVCRMALALARLRAAQGEIDESRAFALLGIIEAGSATLLKCELEALLPKHDA